MQGSTRDGYVVKNGLLTTLPPRDFELFCPMLELVELKDGASIHEAGSRINFVYFVESGLIRHSVAEVDPGFDVALVSRTGFVGISAILGGTAALHTSTVLIPGNAFRVSVTDLQRFVDSSLICKKRLFSYIRSLIGQIAQEAFCNATHDIDQRLSRFLLHSCRAQSHCTITLTQKTLSQLLGVRRPSVTESLTRLESAGVLTRSRGQTTVSDKRGLRKQACNCFDCIEEQFAWQRGRWRYRHLIQEERIFRSVSSDRGSKP